MKLFFISILLAITSLTSIEEQCDTLKFDLEITHTTGGHDNGKIEVIILASHSGVKAFLYGDKKSKNLLDVKINKLDNLQAGTYLLILQDNECSSVKRDIIIK